MRYVKEGVAFDPCTPELVDGIIATTLVYAQYKAPLVITSGSDGVHTAGGDHDPHYLGYAFDARTRDIGNDVLPLMVVDLREALGSQWRVVVESNHIHCQHEAFRGMKK